MLCQSDGELEILSGTEHYNLRCDTGLEASEVLAYNWIFNGSFVHPSLNPGLSVLTNGDLHFEKILPFHFGIQCAFCTKPKSVNCFIMEVSTTAMWGWGQEPIFLIK